MTEMPTKRKPRRKPKPPTPLTKEERASLVPAVRKKAADNVPSFEEVIEEACRRAEEAGMPELLRRDESGNLIVSAQQQVEVLKNLSVIQKSAARSRTRSELLSAIFIAEGLDSYKIVQIVKRLSEAKKLLFRKTIAPDSETGKDRVHDVPVTVEDTATQAWVADFLAKVMGLYHEAPKERDVKVSVRALTIANDVAGMTAADALRALPDAVEILKNIDPEILKEYSDEAEVVE